MIYSLTRSVCQVYDYGDPGQGHMRSRSHVEVKVKGQYLGF